MESTLSWCGSLPHSKSRCAHHEFDIQHKGITQQDEGVKQHLCARMHNIFVKAVIRCVYMCVYTHTCIYVSLSLSLSIYIYICRHVCIHIYI